MNKKKRGLYTMTEECRLNTIVDDFGILYADNDKYFERRYDLNWTVICLVVKCITNTITKSKST